MHPDPPGESRWPVRVPDALSRLDACSAWSCIVSQSFLAPACRCRRWQRPMLTTCSTAQGRTIQADFRRRRTKVTTSETVITMTTRNKPKAEVPSAENRISDLFSPLEKRPLEEADRRRRCEQD